ncbi:MAG: putative DNA modification/repair radical SAM protein [Anaerovoracaceae bacterium]|jgi:putative DNA modification/repair radical SAM protein
MELYEKLRILADGAKYDASCATSGVERKNVGRMGNASCMGICHSWSADGRCISLMKVLQTNRCVYDCEYCINRRTSDVARASFEPEELAGLVMEFYRRNYIEGLFLSSAVEGSPDQTAERMLRTLVLLREVHGFAGYIHAKIIPGVSPELIHSIGMVADRISVNIEFPTEEGLKRLAPQKKPAAIFRPMKQITETIAERKQLGTTFQSYPGGPAVKSTDLQYLQPADEEGFLPATRKKYKERFAPAGQSSQMIIGAAGESDREIIKTSESLYRGFRMKRVYYSAYIPVIDSPKLPSLMTAPPLVREHRLYQSDWLMRFYGFQADEILDADNPFLDLDLDPKVAWALRHLDLFPIEINKASKEELLRVPGIGTVSVGRILRQRRVAAVKYEDLKKIGVVLKRAKYFITCCGRYYGDSELEPVRLRNRLINDEEKSNNLLPINDEVQISMFY